MPALLRHVDDAAPPAVFRAALRGVRRVGPRASYWKTFWFDLGAPANVIEVLALAVRPQVRARGVAGCEWWLGRMRTTDVALDFHHDRDLALFERTGRLRFPLVSSVFFLNRVRGGSLFVTDQRLVRSGGALTLTPAEPRSFASCRPAPNRFAQFSGDCLHGVLDANERVPTGRVPGPPARQRLSIVFNWWDRRPEGVREWRETRAYPELRWR